MDNAQAALYFHTIFREAEIAWAFIHEKKYVSGTYDDPASKSTFYRKYTCKDNINAIDVTINYNAWVSNHLLLSGTIIVQFPLNSYHSDGMVANVLLTGFSINGHDVRGESSIKYKKGSNDQYTYNVFEGAIHEEGYSKPVLITGSITNGQYERTEEDETSSQDDDVWVYYGTMKGMLHNDPKLNYTNEILISYTDGGEVKNGKVHYKMDCETYRRQGVSKISIPNRPEIIYGYFCSNIDFVSVTNVH